MSKLNKMLFREIKNGKGQFIAAAAVIFIGIVIFSASYMSYRNLTNTLHFYYEEYKFLDYYAEAQYISPAAVKEVQALDGVKKAMGRISVDVGADMGVDKRITVRLVSLPDNKPPAVNDIFFVSGRYFSGKLQNVCLVMQKFAEAYNMEEGDSIKAIINNQIHEFKVDGIVGSPEFIYAMKSASNFTVSNDEFGIVYIKESAAHSLLGYENGYNQLHVIFEEGTDTKAVIGKIENILKPYGFKNGIERKDQLSHTMINAEIKQQESMAYMFPVLFLTVAAMVIYFMQRRLISNQRTLIGVMKAFGYTNRRILWHYVQNSLLISVVGAIPGSILGIYLGTAMTSMYKDVFTIPVMQIRIYWDILFICISLSMGFCLVAGYSAAKRVLGIQPAQAMRAKVPKAGKRILMERIPLIWNRISFGWKMSIRNIFRSRQRSLFTLVGVVFTIMFFMVTLFFLDAFNHFLTKQFLELQRHDYKVVFSKPSSYQDALELTHVEGIKKVEPIIEMPVEIKNGWRKEGTTMIGVVDHNSFYQFIDEHGNGVETPEKGILMAHNLVSELGVRPGDTVKVKAYLGSMEEKEVKVAEAIKQYAGFNCYMNLKEMGQLLGEGKFATGALVKAERGADDDIIKALFEMPGVETVEGRLKGYQDFMQYMDLMYAFIGIMIVFGIIMGFAIIFNSTVINIMERRRELASLKVLGYTRREIENTVFRENMLLGILALVPGVIVGRAACEAFAKQMSVELFTLEVIIYPKTYMIIFVCVFAFIILAQWANKKNMSGLDMVEVLKNREG